MLPGMGTWSKEQFDSQLRIFPEGQIGVEYQGQLVASCGSLILDFELYKNWHNHDEISDNVITSAITIPTAPRCTASKSWYRHSTAA